MTSIDPLVFLGDQQDLFLVKPPLTLSAEEISSPQRLKDVTPSASIFAQ
jgi:hypothetical protein